MSVSAVIKCFVPFFFLVKRFNILFPSVEMQATNRLSIVIIEKDSEI